MDPLPLSQIPENLILGPFSFCQSWLDLWQELGKHLRPRTLYHLSRVSHALHTFTWSHLIPNFCYLKLDYPYTHYLSHSPPPSKLFIPRVHANSLKPLQTVPKLKHLKLNPIDDMPYFWNYFSHLTELESFSAVALGPPPRLGIPLTSFKNLKSLALSPNKNDAQEIFASIALLTSLQSLEIGSTLPKQPQLDDLSNLVNLHDLFFHPDKRDEGDLLHLPPFPSLKNFKLGSGGTCPANIGSFTGLATLLLQSSMVHRERIIDIVSFLTGLTDLHLVNKLGQFQIEVSFSKLTRLTSLVVEPHIALESAQSFSFLTNLRMLQTGDITANVAETLSALTTLEELFVASPTWEFLKTHQKLNNLTIGRLGSIPGLFQNISHLTNLERLNFCLHDLSIPTDQVDFLRPLTNLKSLRLSSNVDQTLVNIPFLTNLEELLLGYSDLTFEGILTLTQNWPNLRKLDLREEREVMWEQDFYPLTTLRFLDFRSAYLERPRVIRKWWLPPY